ncbi:16S rRNA (guanine(527)-N(7))-methyltransferase RsmG [uncultured Jatrophihabitans sp.]|uniref:16S rRNA (guanine(527)-N(7))-methyltransferase RsmG n=1 Tax=uncultured Jatrophihabitans sp. TaxID=1610747 RepID=UPI0035CA61A2
MAHLPAPSAAARSVFGDELGAAERYAELLAGPGIAHGHLGPREVQRLWDRHLVNSAVVTDLLPTGATVVDVGSGAGLPGLPMAIRRVDLSVILLEPMQRRTLFLEQAVGELDLAGRVQVVRGRADDEPVRALLSGQQWVTARAVAPLERLIRWCLPLLAPGGRLLALKGSRAADEVDRFREGAPRDLRDAVADIDVATLAAEDGAHGSADVTTVVRVVRSARSQARRRRTG